MRLFCIALLLSCPLWAQEEAPTKKSIEKWIAQLRDKDEAKRRQAIEELAKLDPEKLIEALRAMSRFPAAKHEKGGLFIWPDVKAPVLRIDGFVDGGAEVMDGRWSNDEQEVTYTLKGLGRGRYKLTGKRRPKLKDAKWESFADEGTMAELQKRHVFLSKTMAIRMPALTLPPFRLGLATTDAPLERRYSLVARVKALGITVRRPSADLADHLFLARDVGYLVQSVEQGSRAQKLGIKPYDVLTVVDGKPITDLKQLETKSGTLEYTRRGGAKGRLKLE